MECSENSYGDDRSRMPHKGRRTRRGGSGSIPNHWLAPLLQIRRSSGVV
jgi:hypothetical protein